FSSRTRLRGSRTSCHPTLLPERFILVHGPIRRSNGCFRIHSGGDLGHADSKSDGNLRLLPSQWFLHGHVGNTDTGGLRLLFGGVRQKDAEFVSAQASHEVTASQGREQNGGEMRENSIAAGVSVRVIGALQ